MKRQGLDLIELNLTSKVSSTSNNKWLCKEPCELFCDVTWSCSWTFLSCSYDAAAAICSSTRWQLCWTAVCSSRRMCIFERHVWAASTGWRTAAHSSWHAWLCSSGRASRSRTILNRFWDLCKSSPAVWTQTTASSWWVWQCAPPRCCGMKTPCADTWLTGSGLRWVPQVWTHSSIDTGNTATCRTCRNTCQIPFTNASV